MLGQDHPRRILLLQCKSDRFGEHRRAIEKAIQRHEKFGVWTGPKAFPYKMMLIVESMDETLKCDHRWFSLPPCWWTKQKVICSHSLHKNRGNSQRRQILLFPSTNMAAMTSHANHQFKWKLLSRSLPWCSWLIMLYKKVTTSTPVDEILKRVWQFKWKLPKYNIISCSSVYLSTEVKVVPTSEFMYEILKCDDSNESYWAVLSGLPRCKNLWSFSLFCLYYVRSIFCFDLFVFFLFYVTREGGRFLHRGWAVLSSVANMLYKMILTSESM